jgi:ribosomal RNA-processing protein 12
MTHTATPPGVDQFWWMESTGETGDGGGMGRNHLQDILNTFTEIIQQETKNPSYHPSATEYYALIMTTLKSATNIDQNHLKSLLHLLTLLIPQANHQILLSQFQIMVELFSHYLHEIPDKKISLYCLTILGDLLSISEGSDAVWRTQSMLKLLNIFLKAMDDSNEKLQKIGHQKLNHLLERHKQQNVKIARGYVAEFCSTILQSCHRSNYKRSLQVVTFLERSLPSFSSSDISVLFRSCLALQECEQPLLTAQVFRTIDSFFQYPFSPSDSSFQAILPEMFSILINNPPRTPDMESIAFYCTSLASAVAALHRANPSGFWSQSPHPMVQVSALLLSRCESEFSQIHCAVGVALKRIISACLDSSSSPVVKELVSVVEMGSQTILLEHPLGQFIDVVKGILHLRFQHAWIFILDPIRTLFSQLPGHTGKVLLADLVRMVSDIYHAISTGVMTVSTGVDLSVRDTLGAIFRSLTLEHFLALVPFRHANQTLSSDLDTSRDWMINILHANLKLVPCKLQDFLSYVLPVAKDLNAVIRSSRSQSPHRPQLKDSQLSILRTRVIQLWSLFPSFCSSSFGAPVDVVTAFPPLAPILDAVMKDPDYPELLHSVVTGLTALATSVKEKYPVPLPPALPKDLEVLQSVGAPVFIPSLLSILEGVDVSTDSTKFQPAVTCVSAWAAVAAPGLVTKVSKRLIQLLLSSTNAESTNESTASSWLAVILALIPYQTEQMIMLLYRTIKPLLSVHESVSMQKRAYKVLHGLLLSQSNCLFKLEPKHQILAQISDSLLTCHVSARHIRLFCVASLIEGIVAEEKALPSGTDQLSQACASVFCETLICLKDANKKSRDGALSLLKVIYAALPPQLVLPHLFAGIVGETPAMRSASILGLTLLVKSTQAKVRQKFSNPEDESDEEEAGQDGSSPPRLNQEELMAQYNDLLTSITQLLPTVLLLLKEESIEETRAILSFTKMCVSVIPRDTLLELLPVIVESILVDNLGSGSEDGKLKAKFSAKIRSLVRKAWQRVGEDAIRPLLPAGDAALLDYIQRQGRRTISKRERRQKKSGAKGSEDGDESNEDSDSDDSEEEEGRQEETKRGKKPTRTKAIRASDFVGAGLPSSLQDLLEDQTAPGGKKSRGAESTAAGGDADEDEEYHVQFSKDGRVMLVPKESKTVVAHSAQTAAEGMELELGGEKAANRFQSDKEDKKESSKKRTREPGEEYRSKKAGGDVWRKGMLEPHAYIPLDARMLTKKNEKNAISHLGIAVQNATKRRLKESLASASSAPYDPNLSGGLGSKKVSTMLSRNQRRAQIKGQTQGHRKK